MHLKKNFLQAIILVALLVSTGFAQGTPSSLNDYLNSVVHDLITTRADVGDPSKQSEASSTFANSSSLVDHSSASALMGAALNLAGLTASSSDAADNDTVAVTASAYSLLAAVRGVDPLNPSFYARNEAWRRFWFTAGYENPQGDATASGTDRAKVVGVKVLLIQKRKLTDAHKARVRTMLTPAAGAFSRLLNRIQAQLFLNGSVQQVVVKPGFRAFLLQKKSAAPAAAANQYDQMIARLDRDELFTFGPDSLPNALWSPDEREYYVNEFLNKYTVGTGFGNLQSLVGEDGMKDVRRLIEENIEPFLKLQTTTEEIVQEVRGAPQLSAEFLTKRREAEDVHSSKIIFDWNIAKRLNWTSNGTFLYKDLPVVGGDKRSAEFSTQFELQLRKAGLENAAPLRTSFAVNATWESGSDWVYKAQGKLTLPIATGIELPLSVTVASPTQVIDETEVRGQFGFTFDVARLVSALTSVRPVR